MTLVVQPHTGRGLDALFAPRGIAVVGASRDPAKLGAALGRSLAGYAARGGRVALINPRDPGLTPSVAVATQDGPVDLAIFCVPAAACPNALRDAAAAGVRAAVVCGGGFAETGADGHALQDELRAVAHEYDVRLLGPNTSGFLIPPIGLTASFVPGAAAVPAGRVAVVAASGGVNHALCYLMAEAGHGVSLGVGIGNGAGVTAADVLDHLGADEHTRAVALHVESVADGPALTAAVAGLSRTRPVVALVVGRHDVAEFAASHTGALATSWRTTRAALAQAGAVLVSDERELVDAVGALSVVRATGAQGVGVVTAQAGPGLLLLDDLRGRDIAVPPLRPDTRSAVAGLLPPLTFQGNPVDTGRPGPALSGVLRAVAADPGIDVIAAYALHEPDAVDLATAVAGVDVPVVFGVGGVGPDGDRVRADLLATGVAVAKDPSGVSTAVAALLADARHRARHPITAPRSSPVLVPDGPLDEDAAKALLGRLGVPTTDRRVCVDRDTAHAALTELGGPVAVKLLDAAVLHKTDVGGVHLGVRDASELDAALDALVSAGATRFLVEAMAPAGIDLVVGARRDPVFGPVVLLGLGGVAAEAIADVSVRTVPAHPDDLAAMPDDLAGRALLAGWRGGPVLDRDALVEVLGALGALLVDHPGLAEIEINPLRLTHAGLIALDAVVVRTETGEHTDAQPDH